MMSDKRDYYEVLGVSKTALDDEIKKAYRKLAKQYHPDRNVGDDEAKGKYAEVDEAYAVLSDTQKRQHYDRFGHETPYRQHSARGPNDVFGDLFGDVFRQQKQRPTARDIQIEMPVEFMEAALGCEKTVRFERNEPCGKCFGAGAERPEDMETCKLCDGQGRIIQGNAFMKLQTSCPQCRGRGKVIKIPCSGCGGNGQITNPIEIEVKVPEGAFDGMRLSVRGQGEMLQHDGERGDLYLQISIQPHVFFERDEENLICSVPIPFSTAVRGGKVEVPCIRHSVEVNVPAGVQSGTVLRLRGQGITDVYYPTRCGDMLVQFDVETPSNLDPEYAELVAKLAELEAKYPGEKVKAYETLKGELNGTVVAQ